MSSRHLHGPRDSAQHGPGLVAGLRRLALRVGVVHHTGAGAHVGHALVDQRGADHDRGVELAVIGEVAVLVIMIICLASFRPDSGILVQAVAVIDVHSAAIIDVRTIAEDIIMVIYPVTVVIVYKDKLIQTIVFIDVCVRIIDLAA